MRRKGILVTAVGGICALAISACGSSVGNYADALGPGFVQVGGLDYQVQVSRELNPYSDEDSAYLAGLPKRVAALPVADEWLGVSLQVYNKTSQTLTAASDFFITDTLGDHYSAIVNPTPNAFSYQSVAMSPSSQLPTDTSVAWFGPTQGEWLLFQIPYASLNNRPFLLHIVNPANPSQQARIELDI
jgi:hypothetical protein